VASPTHWRERAEGQHLELGIAENNLFTALASLGLAHDLFGAGCCRSARSTTRSSTAASMR
jgi:pyruvate dehydrogenase complex dehydrogenase (E1) component